MSRVRLLDLVEEDDRVRMLPDGVDQQSALLEADVAGRRADQPRDGVLLHVLAHVEAEELVAEMQRELLGELGLADAGRAGEEEASGRPIGLTEPGARALDRARDGPDGFFLAEHDAAERLFERSQAIAVGGRGLLGRNSRHARDDFLDVRGRDLDRLDGGRSRRAGSRSGADLVRTRCASSGSSRRPRRGRRSRCRAACSRAGGGRRAWPPLRCASSV